MKKSLKYLGIVFFVVLAQFSVLGQEAQDSTIGIIANEGFTFNTLWRGILGMMFIMLIAYIFSSNRKAINWKTVGAGLSAQLLLAIGVLKISEQYLNLSVIFLCKYSILHVPAVNFYLVD